MDRDRILDADDILDQEGRIRPIFPFEHSAGWVPNGPYSARDETGRPFLEITYREGTAHGPYLEYWPNGAVATEGQFHDGLKEGTWHFYNEDGGLMEMIEFKQGKESSAFPWSGEPGGEEGGRSSFQT